jgi:hypothetical protein
VTVLARLFNRDRLWRWRRWMVALSVLLLLRAVLPEILRRVIVAQAAKILRAQVAVGDVDLALYRGGLVLEDVAVRSTEPAADGAGGAPPLIAWKRLDLELRWLPLIRKTVRLQHVRIDAPRAAIDRLANGRLNLLALLPPAAETPPITKPTPAAAPAHPTSRRWAFGLDHLVLSNGALRFRDLTLKNSQPIELNIEHAEVSDIALDQGVYGTPSKLHLAVAFDQGWLGLDARVTLRDDGMTVDANLNAWDLPLRQTRLYIPSLGWSAFNGALDAALTYRADTGRRSEVSGTVALRDLSVRVPGFDQPALAWRSLTVRVDPLDLHAQHVAVTDVELSDASMLLRLQGGVLLPLLAASLHDAAAETAPPTPTATSSAPAAPTETPEAVTPLPATQPPQVPEKSRPWTWTVDSMDVNDSSLHLLGREAPLDIGVGLKASDLSGGADYPAHVALALTVGDGSVSVDGVLRLHSLGFAGTIRSANLSVPEVLTSATTLPRGLLRAGRLSGELRLEAGMAVPDGGARARRDARVHGHVALAEAQLTTPAGPPLSLGARSIDLELNDLHIAGALPGVSTDSKVAGQGGLTAGDVHLDGKISLTEPTVASPDGGGISGGARLIELTLEDVTAGGVLPPAPGAPTRGDLHGGFRLALADVHAAASGPKGFSVEAQSIDLGLTELSTQGLLSTAPASAPDVHLRDGRLSLAQFKLAGADSDAFLIDTRSFELTLSDLTAGGVLPTVAGAVIRGDLQTGVHVAVTDVHAGMGGSQGWLVDSQSVDLGIPELFAQGLLASDPAPAPDVRIRDGRLSLAQLKLGSQGFSIDTQSVDLGIADLSARGALPSTPSPDVHLRDGLLSLAQFELAGADPKVFRVATRSLKLPINELSLPGEAERPMRVAVGDVRLSRLTAQVTRTTDGLLLPQFAPASTSAPAADAPPSAQPRPVDISVDSFRLTDGEVTALDRTVKPFFRGGLASLNIELRGARWPTLAVDKLHVAATGPEKGTIDVYGGLKPEEGWFEVYGEQLALPPYNPYATTFSSYSIGSGTLSLVTKSSRKGERYYASNSVTLHDLSLQGGAGGSLFQQQFGVPLEMALALMRDLNGNITLDVPVEADAQGTKIDVLSIVSGALRRAIVNALTSPLKLVGAVFGGTNGTVAVPAPIGFRPGRAKLDPSGERQVDQLAAFMANRPGIGVTLDTSVTNADVRWLREQALLQTWDSAGVLGALRGLTQRGTRQRVRQALEARAKDKPAELSAEDTAALDGWLDELPPIPAERLHALANERLAQTETALLEGHGLDATRVKRREPDTAVTDGAPAVRVELGPVAHY